MLIATKTVREGHAQTRLLHFAIADCALGKLLVAAGPHGVCAVFLGDEPETLRQDLRRRFPRMQLLCDAEGLQATVAEIVTLVENPGRENSLVLDLHGTAFQQQVWRALANIPAGQTINYSQLACAVGSPRAVRAVAGACSANPVSVAIPCHRVIRSDGGLSGYRWGIERKRALLAREAQPDSQTIKTAN